MISTSQFFPLLILIGPSASGKSSVARKLNDDQIADVIPTWTTRPRRPDEVRSIEHVFVTEEEFKIEQDSGGFLECKQMFGLPYQYGLPAITQPRNGHISLVVLRAQLIDIFAKHYAYFRVYQIEGSIEIIISRLQGRKLERDEISARLSDYESEVELGRMLADRVFLNDGDLNQLIQAIESATREDFVSQA